VLSRRLIAVVLAAALVGCTAPLAIEPEPIPSQETPTPEPVPEPEPEPVPEPEPEPEPEVTSPLTGRVSPQARPVLTIKLDNTLNAQPHAGLTKADLVYIQEVEYGITRLVAIYSSALPDRIGPVRSARITDIDLLRQFGKPGFAYSGAQRKMLPAIANSSLIDLSPNRNVASYTRDRSRRAPYNYFVNGPKLMQSAPKVSKSKDIGFVFDEDIPTGGTPASGASMTWGGASASFAYKPKSGLYEVTLNGRRASAEESKKGQNAATVVIQYVNQKPSAYFDRGGGNTPKAETIGSGTALVLRDGQAFEATWDRPRPKDGTTFTGPDGQTLAFKPGQTWIVLLNKQRPATLSATP